MEVNFNEIAKKMNFNNNLQTKKVIIKDHALKEFDSYSKEYGFKNILAVYDSNTYKAINITHINTKEVILDANNLHANEIGVELLKKQIGKEIDCLVAIGSGTIHDLVRYCAAQLNIPFISCPTAASVDGFCSNVAAMTFNGVKFTVPAVAPLFVLADTSVIKEAPDYLYKSGVGDLIGKYISLTEWKIGHILTNEFYDEGVVSLTKNALELVRKNLIELKNKKDEAFEALTYALCLSGVSMQMVGNSRPASGAEHHISHLVTISSKESLMHSDCTHGETVGVGTLLIAKFYKKLSRIDNIEKYYVGYKKKTQDELKEMFGDLSTTLFAESKNDVLDKFDHKLMFEKWDQIRNELYDIPSYEELYRIYTSLDLKRSLKDIGVDDSKECVLIKLCPFMRNRLTLARLMWLFDLSKYKEESTKKVLGIEFGSTRIKSVLVDENNNVIAQGSYEWENILVDGLWSYDEKEMFKGLQESYKNLKQNYGKPLTKIDAIGISGMMHGYLPFDSNDKLLSPFRTWRNTNTLESATTLSKLFNFNIPMRWTVAHYYQCVLEKLEHVKDVTFLTTIAGYIHYKLTGKKVLGVGEASGVFPIKDGVYDIDKLEKFNSLLNEKGIKTKFQDIIPSILYAKEDAGHLTKEGALLLDPTGELHEGSVFCAPEGDMETGMVCTNSINPRTANASLGTSENLTIILEKDLSTYYPTVDIVATPDGYPACLIHNNTCTSEINTWASMFEEIIKLSNGNISRGELFTKLFEISKESDDDLGITGFNFLSGEPTVNTTKGKPLFVREIDGKLSLANFMQMQIYSAVATTSIGLKILEKENIKLDIVNGHGGFFKTEFIGQNALSAACNAPVAVMKNATEGGAWGIAILANYIFSSNNNLSNYVNEIFKDSERIVVEASKKEKEKFNKFINNFMKYLPAEIAAAEVK